MRNLFNKILRPFGFLVIKAASTAGTWIGSLAGSFGNAAKEKVNNETAMTVSTLFACIRNVSEDIAKMPLKVYKKEGDCRYEQSDHPLTRLLQYQPNPDMTAISFREAMNAHAMGWGNAYAEIQRNMEGRPIALWPIRTDRVTIYNTDSGRKFYRILTENGQTSDIWAEDIFHLHGLGSDGNTGYNIVQLAGQSIGGALGMDKFAGAYFANGMHQSGMLKHPNNLSKEAQERLKSQMTDEFGGGENAHQIMIIEEGMDFVSNTIDPEASQMIETRQFTVTEFCRWLRVPPHKVADLTRATFSNIEEQNIDYVQDGLTGWCERWEQTLWWKLLSEPEKQSGLYFEHVVEGLLRGNIKTRYEANALMWDRGVLSINEIRSKENLNPIEGGDEHFIPMNFTKLSEAGQVEQVDAMITDIAQRLASRELKELAGRVKYAEQDIGRFKEWLDEFYSKHNEYVIRTISPLGDRLGCVSLLTLEPIMKVSTHPELVFEDRKDKHAQYIANNLRGYYEN